MIKASEGGGGKGIRKVENPDDFPVAFRQVSNDCERCEIQFCNDCYIIGDDGNKIYFFCLRYRYKQKFLDLQFSS